MDPFLTGGKMIREVFLDHATWNDLPYKFEAGTPAISELIGLSSAIRYLTAIGMDGFEQHDQQLTMHALEELLSGAGGRGLRTASTAALWFRSMFPACTRTTSRPCWIVKAWPSAPGITAASR